uniref:(California timema) hypothetical protein n=1 Tax=Timema californicum TaxID=61474 RepID=A0A7R9IWN8_TIMCA|nr:unnamed protein product [Timema californicum]
MYLGPRQDIQQILSLRGVSLRSLSQTCPVASTIYGFHDPSVLVGAEEYFGTAMSVVERDAGFCSGGDDDDLPTDVSEDSIELKSRLLSSNKRKGAEFRKGEEPLQKKLHIGEQKDSFLPEDDAGSHETFTSRSSPSPFRPWSGQDQLAIPKPWPTPLNTTPTLVSLPLQRHPPSTPVSPHLQSPTLPPTIKRPLLCLPPQTAYLPPQIAHLPLRRPPDIAAHSRSSESICPSLSPPPHRPPSRLPLSPCHERIPLILHQQEEPLSLVLRDDRNTESSRQGKRLNGVDKRSRPDDRHLSGNRVGHYPDLDQARQNCPQYGKCDPRLPQTVTSDSLKCESEVEDLSDRQKTSPNAKFSVECLLGSKRNQEDQQRPGPSSTSSTCSQGEQKPHSSQRNYKNMTRERRIEANARERTRVHTISAAFDTLRHTIPAYSHNQKLSKLSVLRIACSYILSLSRIAGQDYSEDQSQPSVTDCVSLVTKTIQTEGKLRRKKDD